MPSARRRRDKCGAVVEAYDTDAYGNTLIFTGPGADGVWFTDDDLQSNYGANSIIYCGYSYNPETEIYYVRNRYYSPTLGRWITRDPIGISGGINLYGYVESAPVTNLDAGGLVPPRQPDWADINRWLSPEIHSRTWNIGPLTIHVRVESNQAFVPLLRNEPVPWWQQDLVQISLDKLSLSGTVTSSGPYQGGLSGAKFSGRLDLGYHWSIFNFSAGVTLPQQPAATVAAANANVSLIKQNDAALTLKGSVSTDVNGMYSAGINLVGSVRASRCWEIKGAVDATYTQNSPHHLGAQAWIFLQWSPKNSNGG